MTAFNTLSRHRKGTDGRCRLCGQEAALRNSHIIPEFLYDSIYDERHSFVSTPVHGGPELTHQKGFRERLLCQECETRLGKHERYVSQVMFHRTPPAPPVRRGNTIYLQGIDYRAFRLFCMGLLWKAGESSLEGFRQVQLGPHAERLRRMILADDPGEQHEYPCTFTVAEEFGKELAGLMIPPWRVRIEGFRAYRMYAAGLGWTFWVSSHIRPHQATNSAIGPDGSLPMRVATPTEIREMIAHVVEAMSPPT